MSPAAARAARSRSTSARARLDGRSGAFSFWLLKCEGTGLDNDRAQLRNAPAALIIEVYKPTSALPGYSLFKKIPRGTARDAVLAAQIIQSADEAVPPVAVESGRVFE